MKLNSEALVIPAALLAEVQATANQERRPADEVLRTIIQNGLREERRWQAVVGYGQERAAASGFTENDVNRLVQEYRQGR